MNLEKFTIQIVYTAVLLFQYINCNWENDGFSSMSNFDSVTFAPEQGRFVAAQIQGGAVFAYDSDNSWSWNPLNVPSTFSNRYSSSQNCLYTNVTNDRLRQTILFTCTRAPGSDVEIYHTNYPLTTNSVVNLNRLFISYEINRVQAANRALYFYGTSTISKMPKVSLVKSFASSSSSVDEASWTGINDISCVAPQTTVAVNRWGSSLLYDSCADGSLWRYEVDNASTFVRYTKIFTLSNQLSSPNCTIFCTSQIDDAGNFYVLTYDKVFKFDNSTSKWLNANLTRNILKENLLAFDPVQSIFYYFGNSQVQRLDLTRLSFQLPTVRQVFMSSYVPTETINPNGYANYGNNALQIYMQGLLSNFQFLVFGVGGMLVGANAGIALLITLCCMCCTRVSKKKPKKENVKLE